MGAVKMRRHVVRGRFSVSERQLEVLRIIARCYAGSWEPRSARSIANQLSRHHSRIQEHIAALRKKGLLLPATKRRGRAAYPRLTDLGQELMAFVLRDDQRIGVPARL